MSRWTGWLVAAIVAVLALAWAEGQARRVAEARAEAKAAGAVATAARRRADAALARFRVDTVRATRWRARWDTLRLTDTIARTDTLTQTVTVYVPRALADSAVGACTDALRSCAAALAAEQAVTRAVEGERDAWRRAARGCRVLGLPCPVVTIGAGATLSDGRVWVGPAVTLGVPIRF